MEKAAFGFVLRFTLVYGVLALLAIAGQTTVSKDYRVAVAEAAGDLQPDSTLAGFTFRVASAE